MAWQPDIDKTQVGVIVDNGVVILTGRVDNYTKKRAAEKAVKSVYGVRAVADNIQVKYGSNYQKTDQEIAKAAAHRMMWNSSVPEDDIEVKVENGWGYLSGEVKWNYQKAAANRAVQDLIGVHGVSNMISIKQAVEPLDIKDKIKKAFERMADVDAKNISVDVDGHTVKLRGKVHSIAEKNAAKKTAYFAPEVFEVKNELEVVY